MFLIFLLIYAIFISLSCTQAERDNIHDPGSTDYYCYECYSSSSKISSSSSINISSSSSEDNSSSSSSEEISSSSGFPYGSLHDSRDGKTYKTIAIGEQTWMAENLNYEIDSSKCYNDSISYCNKYGRLYDWNSATSICPEGWFLPGDKEWEDLIVYVGSNSGEKLKVKNEWYNNNATDIYGFSALPSGKGNSENSFSGISRYGYWWSANEASSSSAYNWYMPYDNKAVSRDYNSKTDLLSVRCIEGVSNYRYYCGETNEYAPATEFCYYSTVYAKCNGATYTPVYYVCIDEVLKPRCGYNNEIYYDPSIEFCYSSGLVGQICKENNSYNPSIYGCDNGVLKRRCGSGNDVYYDPEIEFCTADYEVKNKEVFTDYRDGKTYKYVEIGEQIWMAENLNYEIDGSFCYNNLDDNCIKYGRLYYWETAMIACPEDWHLPSNEEWKTLIDYANPEAVIKLRYLNGWDNYNGTDVYGFSALPGGYTYYPSIAYFNYIDTRAYWWSATEYDDNSVYYLYIRDNYNSYKDFNEYNAQKTYGFSVRCIKD